LNLKLLLILLVLAIPAIATAQSTDIVGTIESAVDQAFKDISTSSRIAVIHIQATSNESTFIINELEHILVTRGYRVVDRAEIDRVRHEQELQYSGEVDDNTAVSLGKFIGTDLVVTGAVTSIEQLRRLRLKVIETQTTIIKGSALVTLSDTQPNRPPTTPDRPQVTRVTITPSTITVNRGETQLFRATVSGSGNILQNVTWSVMGATNSNTRISTGGLLSIPANETAPTLIITATSHSDPSKSETATVTVTNNALRVTGVSVSPNQIEVVKGTTQQFTAIVNGSNNPSQAVTWSIIGSTSSGTGISTNGLLMVAINETATSLTVRATSNADPSRAGSSTVTFPKPPATVTSVTIFPSQATVTKGKTLQLTATVVGTNDPSQTVNWEVIGAADSGTHINSNGLLTVSPNETATKISVKATSTADLTKAQLCLVTVKNPPPPTHVAFKIAGGLGIGFIQQTPEAITSTGMPVNFNMGVSVNISPGNSALVFEPGIRFRQIGTEYNYDISPTLTDISNKETYNYIDIFTKLKIDFNNTIQPYVGLSVGFLGSANGKFELGSYTTETDIKGQCNSTAFDLLLGADFLIGDHFLLGGECDLGITNIWVDEYSDLKTIEVMLNVGYRF